MLGGCGPHMWSTHSSEKKYLPPHPPPPPRNWILFIHFIDLSLYWLLEIKILRLAGLKWEDRRGERKMFHDDKLHNLYSSSNIAKVIRLRRMWRAEQAAFMGETKKCIKHFCRIWREEITWEALIKLENNKNNWSSMVRVCDHCDVPLGSITKQNFLISSGETPYHAVWNYYEGNYTWHLDLN
jgi:hypothetical protein